MQTSEKITLEMKAGALEVAYASVTSGEYASVSDAVEDALLAWQQNRIKADQLANIRARLQQSLDDPHPDLTGAEVDQHLEELFQSSPATKHA
jgi:antitoxin ParD1/3/4